MAMNIEHEACARGQMRAGAYYDIYYWFSTKL